jgi:chitinase
MKVLHWVIPACAISLASPGAMAHVSAGQGNSLQLYSYYTTNPPKVNGNLTDGTNADGGTTTNTTPQEWKDAYVRTLNLGDGNPATLLLMNTKDTLYVGLSYPHGNNGNPNQVTLYFDQGSGGGSHDDALTGATNEHAIRSTVSTVTDMSWNGTAWIADAGGADGSVANEYFTSVFQWEFAVPLKNGKAGDLNVDSTRELGFLLEIFKNGAGTGTFYWDATNGTATNAGSGAGWADIQLGVRKNFANFYASYAVNGNPTMDGNIASSGTGDDAWRGAYRRDIVLSNFNGDKRNATLFLAQNPTSNNLYVGLKVNDSTNSAFDYVRVYQEAETAQPGSTRNSVLDEGQENALQVTTAAMTDYHWASGAWIADGASAGQSAGMAFYTNHYDAEFQISYGAGGNDLSVTDAALIGFTLNFHDNAKAAGSQDYYWEYTANNASILLDETQTPDMFGALGWSSVTFGAPYVQPVFPLDNATVSGTVNVKIYAVDESGVSGVVTAKAFRASDTTVQVTLTRVADQGFWTGAWTTSSLSNGSDTLVLRVTDDDGITMDRLIPLTIDNSGAAALPSVSLTSPAAGSTLSGTQTIAFTAAAGSGSLTAQEASIDGGAFAATTTATTTNWNTVSLTDGSHTVVIRVTNSNGATASTPVTTFLVANAPQVALDSIPGGPTYGGRLVLHYTAMPKGTATIATDSLYVDGRISQALSTSGVDTVQISAWLDGSHTLQIKATDNNGKTGMSQALLIATRNAPSIALDSALADKTVSGMLAYGFDASAVAPATISKVEASFNGGPWRTTKTLATDTVDTRAWSEGAHTVQVRTTDSQGKTGLSSTVKFNIRNAPSIALKGPAIDAFLTDSVTISFEAAPIEPDTVAKTEVSIGGGAFVATTTDTTHTFNTRAFKDGVLRGQVRVTDGSGKTGLSQVWQWVVDNSAPKVSFPKAAYGGERPSGRKGGNILITTQAFDLTAGMDADSAVLLSAGDLDSTAASLLMHDDGKNGDAVAGDNVFSAEVSVTADSTGLVSYSIRARDAMGNDTTLNSAVWLDNTAPTGTLTVEPSAARGTDALHGEVYVSRVLLTGTYSDGGGAGWNEARLVVRNDSGMHVNNSPQTLSMGDSTFRRVIELVPGANFITLWLADRAGNSDSVQAKLTYIPPRETKIVKVSGGSVVLSNGSSVRIPENALYRAEEITVQAVPAAEEPKPLDDKVKLLGLPHEFGPTGTVFRKPVTVTLAYTEADLDPDQDGTRNFDPSQLTVVFWTGQTWKKAGEAKVDLDNRRVSIEVNHFTLFDLAEDNSPAPTSVKAYWDQNPVVGMTTFSYAVPKPGKVSLRILDMGHDLVKELLPANTAVDQEGSVMWDGSNGSGRFAGAGLYVYVFQYKSNDGSTSTLVRKPVGLVRK